MAQKFIITGDIKTGKGYLRLGEVGQHAELRIGYEKIWGGGFWEIDHAARKVILSGRSGDFGAPLFGYLKRMDRELKGYTVLYQEGWNSDPIEIDTSEIEWI